MGCHHRGQELEWTLRLHEFMREAEDLQSWLASQKQVARREESLGGDYEHVLVRRLGVGGCTGAGCGGKVAGPAGLDGEGAVESQVLAKDRPSE